MVSFSEALTFQMQEGRVAGDQGRDRERSIAKQASRGGSAGSACAETQPLYREREEDIDQGRPTEGTGHGSLRFHP